MPMSLQTIAFKAGLGRKKQAAASPAEAAGQVRDGDHVVISGCGAAPLEFLGALARRRDPSKVALSHATAWGALPHLASETAPRWLRFEAYFLPAMARALYRERRVDYVPLTFSQMG